MSRVCFRCIPDNWQAMLTQKVEVVLLVLWQMVTLAASLLLSDCERSIYYCCDPTTKSPLPKRYQNHEEIFDMTFKCRLLHMF